MAKTSYTWCVAGSGLRFLVAALTLGLFLTPWTGMPAFACTCMGGLLAAYYMDRTGTIVVGTLESVAVPHTILPD